MFRNTLAILASIFALTTMAVAQSAPQPVVTIGQPAAAPVVKKAQPASPTGPTAGLTAFSVHGDDFYVTFTNKAGVETSSWSLADYCGPAGWREVEYEMPGSKTKFTLLFDPDKGTLTIGKTVVNYTCPLDPQTPEGAYLVDHWTDRQHGHHAFTPAHLPAMLKAVEEDGLKITSHEYLKGYFGNDDSPDILKWFMDERGSVLAYRLKIDGMLYLAIPANECAGVCGLRIGEPIKLLHLHKAAPKPKKQATYRPSAKRNNCPSQITVNVTGGKNCTGSCAAVKAAEAAARAAVNNC